MPKYLLQYRVQTCLTQKHDVELSFDGHKATFLFSQKAMIRVLAFRLNCRALLTATRKHWQLRSYFRRCWIAFHSRLAHRSS